MDFLNVESGSAKRAKFSHMLRVALSTRLASLGVADLTLLKKYVIILKKAFFSKSEKKCVKLPQNGATAQYSSAEG